MKTGTLIELGVGALVGCGLPVVILFLVSIGLLGAWRARRRAMAMAAAWEPPPPAAPPVRPAWERWAAGAWGIWSGSEDSAAWDRERAVKSLEAWYGATDAAGLESVIAGLRGGTTGNAAWDQVRAVDLVRIGQAAGYVGPDRAAALVREIAGDLRGRYGSWEECARGFEAGMNAWQDGRGITSEAERGRVQRNLPYLRGVAWPSADWALAI